ncbi:MAG: TlpA family protein disulfide reductase [Acidobacteriaceae bacterium]
MTMRTLRACSLILLACASATGCNRGTISDQIGRPAPVFAISDGQHSVNLAAFRGKVVILNFWASWCPPCVEEMPTLQALQQQVPQVQVIAIASQESFADYQQFLTRQHITLLTVLDRNQTSNKLYGSFKFPETYVIDPRGVIRRKLIGAQDFTNPGFERYLKKLGA